MSEQSFEPIYAALFAKLAAITGLVTTSRVGRHWTNVRPEEQPALFLVEDFEHGEQKAPPRVAWTLRPEVWIYTYTNADSSVPGATALNALLFQVRATLEPSPGTGRQTLGGLVHSCRIAGDIEKDAGLLGPQSVAVIPVEIIVP